MVEIRTEVTGLALITPLSGLTAQMSRLCPDYVPAVTRNERNVARHMVHYNSPGMGSFRENLP
jgi:hypothetical protein